MLSLRSLVGLCYLHDPARDPRADVQEATKFANLFRDLGHSLDTMYVFRITDPDGVSGDLLLSGDGKEADGSRGW